MKRKAEYDLNRDELESNDYDMPAPQSQNQSTSGSNDMSQRRIVKLKLPSEVLAERKIEEGAKSSQFILADSLTSEPTATTLPLISQQQTQQQTPVSFLAKTITPTTKDTSEAIKSQISDISSKPSSNLFNLNGSNKITDEPKKDEQPKVSLFAGLFGNNKTSTSGSLFDNSNSLFSKTGGLFNSGAIGSVQPNGLLSSIFANLPKDEPKEEKIVEMEKPVEKPKAGLFSNFLNSNLNQNTASLFSKVTEAPTSFKSLLSNQNAPKSFFNNVKKDDEDDEGDDGEDGGEDGERSPSPEPDPSQTGDYKYDDHFEKIIAKEVEKFKVNQNPLLGKGTISLNKSKEVDAYFIIFRNPAKLIQYQGQLIKTLSKISKINNKQDALTISAFNIPKSSEKPKTDDAEKKEITQTADTDKKAEPSKPSIAKDVLKLMFTSTDASAEFQAAVEKVI